MRQFAAYILIAVGLFSLMEAALGIAGWIGCVMQSGFLACEATAKTAQEILRGLITLGLGLLYQNQNQKQP